MFVDRRPTFPQPTDSTFVLTYFQRDYIETKKMKIPNYDPAFSESKYKQGDPCMPTDVFRMLICGPTNSGKTNTLLHMVYELLECDNFFFKEPAPEQIPVSFAVLRSKINPKVGYEVIEAPGDGIIPLEELPVDNQKIVATIVCESNQNSIINYFINGRHRNCSVSYFTQTFYKVPKNIRDNCSHFCIFRFLPRENKRIADEIGVDHDTLDRATDKNNSFFYYDKPRKLMKKISEELKVRQVPEGTPVHRDPKVRQVPEGTPVYREPKGRMDRRAQKATKVILDRRVVPAVPLILTCKISTIFCD